MPGMGCRRREWSAVQRRRGLTGPGLGRRDALKIAGAALLALGTGRLFPAELSALRQGERSSRVRTVRGDVPPSELGVTLIHEHLLLAHSRLPPEGRLDDRDLAAKELAVFARHDVHGWRGRALVEVTSLGMRGPQHADSLRAISEQTGVHVVMGTGFHKREWHPTDLARWSRQAVEELLVEQILEGIGPGAIKAGIIGEIGISDTEAVATLDAEELKVLRASAGAHRRTGAALTLHFDHVWRQPCRNGALRLQVLRYLRDREGIDLHRVIVSHLSPLERDEGLHRQIIELGAYVSFDMWGSDLGCATVPDGDYGRFAAAVKRLVQDEACAQRVLLSQDVCMRWQLSAYGGCGYAHLVRDVLPHLRAHGMTERQLRLLLIENPMRALSLAVAAEHS